MDGCGRNTDKDGEGGKDAWYGEEEGHGKWYLRQIEKVKWRRRETKTLH